MAAWPGTLPQSFLIESLTEFRRQKQSEHFTTDVGPGITLPRTTAYSEFFSGDMYLTPTQYDTLIAFYDTTLIGGSQPFDWKHPVTLDSAELKFHVASEDHLAIVEAARPDYWRVHMAFEILPS